MPVVTDRELNAAESAEISRLREIIQTMRYAEDLDKLKVTIENYRLADEVAYLKARVKQLEGALYTSERQAHLEMGR